VIGSPLMESGNYAAASAKTVFQSFLMLTTVQPCAAAVSSDFSAPAV